MIRYDKKRVEEGLEVMTRKAAYLRAQINGSTVLEKLRQEVKEYRGILKCSICLNRQKEVKNTLETITTIVVIVYADILFFF